MKDQRNFMDWVLILKWGKVGMLLYIFVYNFLEVAVHQHILCNASQLKKKTLVIIYVDHSVGSETCYL